MNQLRIRIAGIIFTGVLFAGIAPALAAGPQFSNGQQISTTDPYSTAQSISSTTVFSSASVYGKLQGTTPVDIYKFTPDKSGDQTVDLMERKQSSPGTIYVDPVLILADPTSNTQSADINLPSPGDAYHFALLTQITARTYTEPALLQKYSVLQEQTLSLVKGKTYYFIVVPASSSSDIDPYVIKLGIEKSWTAADVFTHFSGWLRLETADYAGSSPFVFNRGVTGLLLVLLGIAILIGTLILQETYALLSNRVKTAGYLLIKMQMYSRVLIWVGLALTVIGGTIVGYTYGLVGIPFVLSLLYLIILINMLYLTFALSFRIEQLEVTKKEATIPFPLRKRWFFSSLVSLFSYGAFVVYLAIYLIAK